MVIYIGIGTAILIVLGAIVLRMYLIFLVDKRISSYQNDLILKHCDEIHHVYSQMRGWRHDYHNHIQAMKAFLSLGQEAEHADYLNKLDADLISVDTVLKTGNVMMDAILNSKISLAVSKQIQVNVKASVPEKLVVSEIDLCVIIGNLIDNATEACMKLDEMKGEEKRREREEPNRFIRIFIGKHKEMLYISVSNSVGGEVKRVGESYLSTKNSPSHGFGLIRIDRITAKYDGFINRQSEDGVFATEIMLPL